MQSLFPWFHSTCFSNSLLSKLFHMYQLTGFTEQSYLPGNACVVRCRNFIRETLRPREILWQPEVSEEVSNGSRFEKISPNYELFLPCLSLFLNHSFKQSSWRKLPPARTHIPNDETSTECYSPRSLLETVSLWGQWFPDSKGRVAAFSLGSLGAEGEALTIASVTDRVYTPSCLSHMVRENWQFRKLHWNSEEDLHIHWLPYPLAGVSEQ